MMGIDAHRTQLQMCCLASLHGLLLLILDGVCNSESKLQIFSPCVVEFPVLFSTVPCPLRARSSSLKDLEQLPRSRRGSRALTRRQAKPQALVRISLVISCSSLSVVGPVFCEDA
ncbi:hypothetical protein IWX50DRAFT_483340 [Phyllosticta citricarpa]